MHSFKVTQLLKREEGWELRYPNPRESNQAVASPVRKTETGCKGLNKQDDAFAHKAPAVIRLCRVPRLHCSLAPSTLFSRLCEGVSRARHIQPRGKSLQNCI